MVEVTNCGRTEFRTEVFCTQVPRQRLVGLTATEWPVAYLAVKADPGRNFPGSWYRDGSFRVHLSSGVNSTCAGAVVVDGVGESELDRLDRPSGRTSGPI